MNMDFSLTGPELERLGAVRVGIAGAGGLGSNCAMHLVRSGIRRLVIADFDTVSTGNLNRQFFFADQVGRPKVEALRENLLRIAPDLELELYCCRVDEENAGRIFAHCEPVVEAFDDAAAKRLLINLMLRAGKTVVAASGIAGWGRSGDMRLQQVGRRLYLVGDGESAVDDGAGACHPTSPRVGLAAAMQANTVMALLLGIDP